MIRFEIRGIRFSMPLLALLAPLLAARLGMQAEIIPLLLALGVHETAHLAAACIAGIKITEVRILPFGGSMRMENPYHLTSARLIFVALAGPCANFLLILLISAAAQWAIIRDIHARNLLYPNILLCLFNMMPALPLDGGRILVALLSIFLGEEKALRPGIYCGRALAVLLAAAMLAGGIWKGIWNISFLFAAIFIIISERDEQRALSSSKMHRICEAMDGFDMRQTRIYQIDGKRSASQALKLLKPNENTWFIITKSGCPHSLLDSRSLIQHMIDHPAGDQPLISLSGYRLCAFEK